VHALSLPTIGIAVTTKIYDLQNTLIETDVPRTKRVSIKL